MKAMIFAAGLGTRFKPWTDSEPKALAVINGKSLLERNIRYLQTAGVFDVMVNVHHFADKVEAAIAAAGGWGSRIRISDERSALLETGGGLKKAEAWFDEGSFLVLNADILTDLDLRKLVAAHRSRPAMATIAVTNRHSSRFFLFDDALRLRGWCNETTGELRLAGAPGAAALQPGAFSGIHVISPDIFPLMPAAEKFSIVDTYLEIAEKFPVYGFDHSGSRFVDVGKPEAVALAEALFP